MKRMARIQQWLSERVLLGLLCAAVLTVGMGALRPKEKSGLYEHVFWIRKIEHRHNADLVAGGDSRVVMGIDPQAMTAELPELRIVNYGFNGTGFSQDYLDAIERVLDPHSQTRIILLGISPRSLSNDAAQRNMFTAVRDKPATERFMIRHFPGVLRFFEPLSFKDAWHGLVPSAKQSWFYEDYRPTGWVDADKSPRRPDQKLDNYIAEFKKNPVTPAVQQQVMEQVRQWTQQGIVVYGFRPPTTAKMVAIENEHSGFDHAAVRAEFTSAGGRWIPLPQDDTYPSYDGSHLCGEAAQKLSHDIAAHIAADQPVKSR